MNAAEERNVIPMPSADGQQPGPGQNPDLAQTAGNIDKIREILFGAQARDYERRFVRLEEKLSKEAAESREDSRRRFEALENYIKQEIAAISDRIRSENQQRTQVAEDITRELRDLARSMAGKMAQMDEQSAHNYRDLRQQLLDQSKILSDDLRNKQDEMSAALTREARELQNSKTDREALANLFNEVAMRLKDEFRLPGE
jgi:hypothetical protein